MPQPSCYLFLGSDRPRKLQRIQELERALKVQPLDRHHLDASAMTSAQLLALCRQQPATSPIRLVVVDQAHRLDQAFVEAFQKYADIIAQSATLILLVEIELSARQPLSKITAAMQTERFPGRDVPALKPFALTDALGTRDMAGVLMAVSDQLQAGKAPLELIGLVAWQLQRWVTARRLLDGGVRIEQIASLMNLKPWQVERVQTEVAHRSLTSLQDLLARCWQLDVDAKRGRAIPELAIEQLVTEVCLAAPDEAAAARS